MASTKQINVEIELLTSLKTMLETYAEIAASRMQRTRRQVLQQRAFLSGLSEIFQQVQASYRNEVTRFREKETIRKKRKTALVLLSANTGLYGDLVRRSLALFLQNLKAIEATPIIIGRIGRLLFQEARPGGTFTYFDLPDVIIEIDNLRSIIQELVAYENVLVIHGEFQSIIMQTPRMAVISGTLATSSSGLPRMKYLFEPSLSEVMRFFETEVFASIFEQSVAESQLAKFASRMMTLDSADEYLNTSLKQVNLERIKEKHAIHNKKQLSAFSGMALWRRQS